MEVPVVASPMSGHARRVALKATVRERIRSSPLALSRARRAWNRERGVGSSLRCECARPSCRAWLPALAETHRRAAGQFVVAPAHFHEGVVVRAADRFFVVERSTTSAAL